MTQPLDPDRMLPSEAVTAFAAWLTTRSETLNVGDIYDASEMARLTADFIAVNELRPIRDEFKDVVVRHPVYPKKPRPHKR